MALVHESIGDFVLFPRDPSYHSMAPENDTHGLTSSYDSYSSMAAYPAAPPAYYNTSHYLYESTKPQEQQRFTPARSPSPSISQAFEHPPSTTLSSASGASVQSTASSAVGSPYSHATHNISSHDQWTESQHGLGIASGLVHSNDGFGHEMTQWGGIEDGLMFDNSKLQDSFVGESEKVLSSSISSSCSMPLPTSSSSAPQAFLPQFPIEPRTMASDPSTAGRNITIDTILEEVNSTIQSSPRTVSPASANSTRVSPLVAQASHGSFSSPIAPRSFKSPTTPASAMSPFFQSPALPQQNRQRVPRRHSVTASRAQNPSASPADRYSPYSRPNPVAQPTDQFPSVQSQNPFFGQSSGRFIPPLESSCWFSLILSLSAFFLF